MSESTPDPTHSKRAVGPGLPATTAAAVSVVALVLALAGLLAAGIGMPKLDPIVGGVAILAGNGLAVWLHQRLRGVIPLRWFVTAVLGAAIVVFLTNPLYTRAGLAVSAAATAGAVLQAWRRPVDALVAVSGIGTALAGHAFLRFAIGLPDGDTVSQITRSLVLFGALGSLTVGTSSTLVWCQQNLPGPKGKPFGPIAMTAWVAMGLSAACAAALAFVPERAPALTSMLWAAAAFVHVAALAGQLGVVLGREFDDELDFPGTVEPDDDPEPEAEPPDDSEPATSDDEASAEPGAEPDLSSPSEDPDDSGPTLH